MVGGVSGQHHTAAEGHRMLLGNICLLSNTVAMAVYFITAKQLVMKYPPMCVAAWAYIVAAVCMGGAAVTFVDHQDWQMPRIMLGPLVYWVVVCSVIGYYVVTWATQYLPASQVACSHTCVCPGYPNASPTKSSYSCPIFGCGTVLKCCIPWRAAPDVADACTIMLP